MKKVRFKKVFLIFPNYGGKDMGAIHPPLGIGCLAEALRRSGIEYDVIDGRLYAPDEILRRVSKFSPDLVGVSMMTLLHKNHYALVKKIKELMPHLKIVAGGPHISTMREDALRACLEIDYGMALEGEDTLVELCMGIEAENIKGLIHRDNGKVIYNGNRAFRCDMDNMGFPTYEKFELKNYLTNEIGILTSRGCPYLCTYCPVKTAIGSKFRMRSAKSMADEVEYWVRRGYKKFDVIDDNFTLVKKRVYAFCDELERRGFSGLELKCGNGVRADKLDRELLKRMKRVGFKYLSIGVEAASADVLKKLRKGEDIAAIKQAITYACELGFDVTLFFLVGSPGERWKDFEESVNMALSYPILDARFYNLIPFPGTELFEYLVKNNYLLSSPDEYLNDIAQFDSAPLFYTPEMNIEERKKALIYAKKIRLIVKKKAMERKFQRFGPLKKVAAAVYVTDMVQNKLLHNRIFRRATRVLYDMMAN